MNGNLSDAMIFHDAVYATRSVKLDSGSPEHAMQMLIKNGVPGAMRSHVLSAVYGSHSIAHGLQLAGYLRGELQATAQQIGSILKTAGFSYGHVGTVMGYLNHGAYFQTPSLKNTTPDYFKSPLYTNPNFTWKSLEPTQGTYTTNAMKVDFVPAKPYTTKDLTESWHYTFSSSFSSASEEILDLLTGNSPKAEEPETKTLSFEQYVEMLKAKAQT